MTTTTRERKINIETTAYDGDAPFPEAASYPEFVAQQLVERYGEPVECSVGSRTQAFLYGFGEDESALADEIADLVKVGLWDDFCTDGYKAFSATA